MTATMALPGFGRLLLAEWTKIRSVRSTVWSLILLVLLNVGFTALLMSFTVAQWDKTAPADRAQWTEDPASSILGSGMFLSQLAICVLGAMVITSEHSTGMIRASLPAVPRRTPMPAAKALVFGLVALVLGVVVSAVSFFLGAAILHAKVTVAVGDPGVAITGVIGFVFVLSPLAQLLPGRPGGLVLLKRRDA
ncbi:hypothetical protein E1293_20150 [Actinomadura darangshiensis]|uniref:ABC transporter permease n=1 Tax=Actinomadura darangshiensis TaxID=705336 RepID=A0A4V2YVA8_9ACTN|nr:ABC transporter permease [Actinomadura darangshiensis]TDD80667.1 hypothetical protein E1293_20150 [Actinomadura darangshiensis]